MSLLAAALLIGCIPLSFLRAALNVDAGWTALIALLLGPSGLIVLVIVGSSFPPVYIDATRARFKGASEDGRVAHSSPVLA